MKKILVIGVLGICLFLAGCVTNVPPATYYETVDPGWKVIPIRENLGFETAWQMLVDRIRKSYDIEIMDKDSGYLRTGWIYTSTGSARQDYKTRITIKFAQNKEKLELKIDAAFHKIKRGAVSGDVKQDYGWLPGSDSQLADDVYGDLSALLGRVRR